ncbi:immunity protein Tsi6 family protein [Pseudomonas putida]
MFPHLYTQTDNTGDAMRPIPPTYVQKAIDLAEQRNKAGPHNPPYAMLLSQLDYIKAVCEGHEQDTSKLHQLNRGAIASKDARGKRPLAGQGLEGRLLRGHPIGPRPESPAPELINQASPCSTQ